MRLYWGYYDSNALQSMTHRGTDIRNETVLTAYMRHFTVPMRDAPKNHCEGRSCDGLCVLTATSFFCVSEAFGNLNWISDPALIRRIFHISGAVDFKIVFDAEYKLVIQCTASKISTQGVNENLKVRRFLQQQKSSLKVRCGAKTLMQNPQGMQP